MENELHRATPEEVWSFLRTSSDSQFREHEETDRHQEAG